MDDDLTSTIRITRKPTVITDDVGGQVWMDSVKSAEFEILSTMRLKVMLDEDPELAREQLKQAASAGDGLIARNVDDNTLNVMPDDTLRAALNNTPGDYESEQTPSDLDELTLVSTQMLRVVLEKPELTPKEVSEELELIAEQESMGGFDPYNNC
ncbi:MAG: hypothetical protein AAAFM81_04385 [Pseudomonadota bacterium]